MLRRSVSFAALLASFAWSWAAPASAMTSYGPNKALQVSGSLETQNLFRHPTVDKFFFVQQRNTFRLRLDFDVVKENHANFGFAVPGFRTVSFFFLYRPVYESILDIQPGGRADEFPYRKDERDGSLHAFDAVSDIRDAERNSNGGINAVREIYADLVLDGLPLSLRIGKQQIQWGESDQFRMMDRVNPLDLTWHGNQENFTEERKPLTMIKALYRFGDVMGMMSQAFFEVYWGLGDWTPVENKFLPYPWSAAPLESPILNEATCRDPNNLLTCQNFEFVRGRLFRKGDYDKNPIDNGQVGARFVFGTPQGVQLGLAYFYQRFNFDDGSQATSVRGLDLAGPTPSVPTNNLLSIANGTLPAEVVYPYIHTVGLTANYDDADWTGAVYRLETIYELDIPFADLRKPQLITNPACVGAPSPVPCELAPFFPSGLHFASKADMWNGLIGFDRDTPMPWLNRRKTISFSGQFFWHHVMSGASHYLGVLNERDRVRDWEFLFTLAAYTDYFTPLGNDQPAVFVALDPMNRYNMELGWTNKLFYTNDLVITLFQNYFVVPGFGGEVDEPWGIGGVFKKRDETGVKVTYQF